MRFIGFSFVFLFSVAGFANNPVLQQLQQKYDTLSAQNVLLQKRNQELKSDLSKYTKNRNLFIGTTAVGAAVATTGFVIAGQKNKQVSAQDKKLEDLRKTSPVQLNPVQKSDISNSGQSTIAETLIIQEDQVCIPNVEINDLVPSLTVRENIVMQNDLVCVTNVPVEQVVQKLSELPVASSSISATAALTGKKLAAQNRLYSSYDSFTAQVRSYESQGFLSSSDVDYIFEHSVSKDDITTRLFNASSVNSEEKAIVRDMYAGYAVKEPVLLAAMRSDLKGRRDLLQSKVSSLQSVQSHFAYFQPYATSGKAVLGEKNMVGKPVLHLDLKYHPAKLPSYYQQQSDSLSGGTDYEKMKRSLDHDLDVLDAALSLASDSV